MKCYVIALSYAVAEKGVRAHLFPEKNCTLEMALGALKSAFHVDDADFDIKGP